jgi:hypothetical protein
MHQWIAALSMGVLVLQSDVARPGPYEPRTCEPFDHAAKHPDLFLFRARLQLAVARRDVETLVASTGGDIHISFGPNDGLTAFKRELADPRGETWSELASVLALGGSFETPGSFAAPYTYGCADEGEIVVMGRDVNVRSKPSNSASVVTSVSFLVLRGHLGSSTDGWADVELPDGRKGYIAGQYVKGPFDRRAYLSKVGNTWRLTAFIGGD